MSPQLRQHLSEFSASLMSHVLWGFSFPLWLQGTWTIPRLVWALGTLSPLAPPPHTHILLVVLSLGPDNFLTWLSDHSWRLRENPLETPGALFLCSVLLLGTLSYWLKLPRPLRVSQLSPQSTGTLWTPLGFLFLRSSRGTGALSGTTACCPDCGQLFSTQSSVWLAQYRTVHLVPVTPSRPE